MYNLMVAMAHILWAVVLSYSRGLWLRGPLLPVRIVCSGQLLKQAEGGYDLCPDSTP